MRTDQWMGLSEGGEKYLERFQVGYKRTTLVSWDDTDKGQVATTTEGRDIPEWRMREIDVVAGAWTDIVGILYEFSIVEPDHTLTEYAREAVQAEIWNSGPCYFIALKDKDGKWIEETLWSEKELSEA